MLLSMMLVCSISETCASIFVFRHTCLHTRIFTCHCKNTDDEADIAPSEHDLLCVGILLGGLLLSARPDAHSEYHHIEDDYRNKTTNEHGHS